MHFWNKADFTQCCGLPGTARHTPNPKTAGIVRFPLNAHNLLLWFTIITPDILSWSLTLVFHNRTQHTPSQRFLFWSCSLRMCFSLRRLKVLENGWNSQSRLIFLAQPAALRFCTLIKNDYLKTDDLYIFLLHCAPGRLSWPPKLRNKLKRFRLCLLSSP